MEVIRCIIQRLRSKQSKRQIHRELNVHRCIIREINNLAIVHDWLNPDSPMPSNEVICSVRSANKKNSQIQHPLDLYKNLIEEWHTQGHSSVVIHRLLQDKYPCDIQVIRRYRKKNFPDYIEPVMVRSTVAGRDLEVDFGELGRFYNQNNELKRVWVFSLRLRHSRRAYREIVLDQKMETFLMGHVHAFEHFNGVPQNCILDNLKAGVIKSTIDNDSINRSYQELAEHYGFIISPCLPRTPNHKGGVEGDIKYVKRNFLSYFLEKQKEFGRTIPNIRDLKEALDKWTTEVDNVRIVQGVGLSPMKIFCSEEEKALKLLPKCRWEFRSWSQSTVRRDWRIMFDSAYYSVPYQLIGKIVAICSTNTFVRIFYENKEVAFHERATNKWEYKRKKEHAPPDLEAVLNCSREGLLGIAEDIGPFTYELAKSILSHPSVDKLRPVRYLLNLSEKYPNERLEKACERAFNCKLFSYNSVKNILEKELDFEAIDSSDEDKIVTIDSYRFARDSSDYSTPGFSAKETFNEKLCRLHPYSKYGNAMMSPFEGIMADSLAQEEEKRQEGNKREK